MLACGLRAAADSLEPRAPGVNAPPLPSSYNRPMPSPNPPPPRAARPNFTPGYGIERRLTKEMLAWPAVHRALERQRLVRENLAYQRQLEQKVAEATEHLEQKIRELTALNELFQKHLAEKYQTEASLAKLSAEVARLAKQVTGNPRP